MKRLFKQFSLSGRHSEPRRARNARLDPRRRRARLLADARVRRGVRQSRPDRRLRDRRRRSGNRTARDSWHSNKFLNPAHRRRGAADPASERLQDRRTRRCWRASRGGAGAAAARATARSRSSSRATIPPRCTGVMAATLDRVIGEIRRDPERRARDSATPARPRWPMIVLRTPKGWTGPQEVDGLQIEGTLARASGAAVRSCSRIRRTCACSKSGCGAIGRRNCSTSTAALRPELRGARAAGQAPHGRQPARQRRVAVARSAPAGLPRLRRRRHCAGRA